MTKSARAFKKCTKCIIISASRFILLYHVSIILGAMQLKRESNNLVHTYLEICMLVPTFILTLSECRKGVDNRNFGRSRNGFRHRHVSLLQTSLYSQKSHNKTPLNSFVFGYLEKASYRVVLLAGSKVADDLPLGLQPQILALRGAVQGRRAC